MATVRKNPENTYRVAVSPNLYDWYSGSKYTTIIEDNEVFLKARDNAAVSPSNKRRIRVVTRQEKK